MVLLLVFAPLVLGLFLLFMKSEPKLWTTALLGAATLCGLAIYLLLCGGEWEIFVPYFSHFGIGFASNPLSLVYAVLTCAMFFLSVVTSREYFLSHQHQLNRYYATLFLTLSGCLGVFFAHDLFTLFVFFELMSFTSYFWVLHNETEEARSGSNLYLAFAVTGGMSVLLGIFGIAGLTDDLRISMLKDIFQDPNLANSAILPGLFLFFGFGAKAGVFLVHDWLPVAHTVAPAPTSGLLSGILTKCGIYGILVLMLKILPEMIEFTLFVLILSLCNMFFGAFSAFMSGNLKRTLAFSTVSQVGFILWGIAFGNLLGEHNTFAFHGTLYHMLNHSLIKVLLFSLAGIVYQQAHSLTLTELKGFGRGKPWFQGLFTIGALSLAAVPLFSAYVSKTLLHEAVIEYLHLYPDASFVFHVYEWIFLISGGFTVAYMLKLYSCLFWEQCAQSDRTVYATGKTLLGLSVIAGILLVFGLAPQYSLVVIGDYCASFFGTHSLGEVAFFSVANLRGAIISLVIGVGLFCHNKLSSKSKEEEAYREKLNPSDTFVDKVYKPWGKRLELLFVVIMRIFDVSVDTLSQRINQYNFKSETIPETFYYGEDHLEKRKPLEVKITQSLAYSLLMFGLGFIFTIVYLLVVGGTLS
ncbi:MAG: complex I subunit 5 family protein [Eubacteriales bacterium]